MTLFGKDRHIKLETVDLGQATIRVPVARLGGKLPGPSVLVTAGMDGDEYEGIDAAYVLIEQLRKETLCGSVTIIPVVNIPGFEAYTSRNPLDGLFPKSFYPGKAHGTPTERLIWWLSQTFVRGSDVWIDLHGGALNEELVPFVYLYETKQKPIAERTQRLFEHVAAERIALEKPGAWERTERIARDGCAYILTESGYGGLRNPTDRDRHIKWVQNVLNTMGMVSISDTLSVNTIKGQTVYRITDEYYAPQAGLWYPGVCAGARVKDQAVLGVIRTLTGKTTTTLRARSGGDILWMVRGVSVIKGEIVTCVARQ